MFLFVRIMVLCILCFSLSGCWSHRELNELGITTAIGVDRSNGEWVTTFQMIVPSAMSTGTGGASGANASQTTVHVFSTKAKTIREAVTLSDLESPRWLYFAHNNVLVIGLQAAKEGIGEIVDLFFRSPDARESVFVLLAENKASDILKLFVPPERIPGIAMADVQRKQDKTASLFPAITMYDLALKINSDARGVGVPEVILTGEGKELQSLDIYKKTSIPSKVKLSRLGVFRGDRLVGWMSLEESRGISWLSDQIKSTTITFNCQEAGKGERPATFRIDNADTKIIPHKSGEHFTMHFKVKARGSIIESTCEDDLTKPESIQRLRHKIEKQIQKDMEQGWNAMKKLKVDLPGFADKVHRRFPNDWKQMKGSWESELAKLEATYEVDVKVLRLGLFLKSFDELKKDSSYPSDE